MCCTVAWSCGNRNEQLVKSLILMCTESFQGSAGDRKTAPTSQTPWWCTRSGRPRAGCCCLGSSACTNNTRTVATPRLARRPAAAPSTRGPAVPGLLQWMIVVRLQPLRLHHTTLACGKTMCILALSDVVPACCLSVEHLDDAWVTCDGSRLEVLDARGIPQAQIRQHCGAGPCRSSMCKSASNATHTKSFAAIVQELRSDRVRNMQFCSA